MRLDVDPTTNTLRLAIDGQAVAVVSQDVVDGVLDVGKGGRLIGVEFPASAASLRLWMADSVARDCASLGADGRAYIQIDPDLEGDTRAAELTLTLERDIAGEIVAVVIPRLGLAHEISYPSGNQ